MRIGSGTTKLALAGGWGLLRANSGLNVPASASSREFAEKICRPRSIDKPKPPSYLSVSPVAGLACATSHLRNCLKSMTCNPNWRIERFVFGGAVLLFFKALLSLEWRSPAQRSRKALPAASRTPAMNGLE
jgi:hypothetical protein